MSEDTTPEEEPGLLDDQIVQAFKEVEAVVDAQEKAVAEAFKLAESLGLSSEDFDDLVHDAKGFEAAEINNCGMADQLDYLASGAEDPGAYLNDLIRAVASGREDDAETPDPA